MIIRRYGFDAVGRVASHPLPQSCPFLLGPFLALSVEQPKAKGVCVLRLGSDPGQHLPCLKDRGKRPEDARLPIGVIAYKPAMR